MAKTNSLRVAVVVMAAVVAALLLVTVNQARAVKTTATSGVDRWSTVKEVTGTLTVTYDEEGTNYSQSLSGSLHNQHTSQTVHVSLPKYQNETEPSEYWRGVGLVDASEASEDKTVVTDAGGTDTTRHYKRHGTVKQYSVGGQMLSIGNRSTPWTAFPDGPDFAGDYYWMQSPSARVPGALQVDDLLTGKTSNTDLWLKSIHIRKPLPTDCCTLQGTATVKGVKKGGNVDIVWQFKYTWNLTGTQANQTKQIKVTAKKKFISPNEEVTFEASDQKGNPVNAKWSGGGTPKTHTGTTFTTRFDVSPGFQGQDMTVSAQAVKGGATAKGEVKVLKPSGTDWVGQYPGDDRIAALDAGFQANVQDFDDALANAGAARSIGAVYRPPERAHLMFYARKIAVDGMDPLKVPTPNCTRKGSKDGPIYVAWAHYKKKDGTYDKSGSVAAAKKMLAPTRQGGYGIGKNPVAHPSRHEIRRAIDWNITWNGALKIAWGPNGGPNGGQAGTIDKITTTPHTGLNKELWKVGASYGVIKFESVNRTKDAPHWSDNGH